MINIDFLPDKYREQYHIRLQRTWRVAVVTVFVGIVVAAASLQYWMKRDAQMQLDAIAATHVESLKINQQLSQLFRALDSGKQHASLLTYLRHRWPATQLVSHTVSPLEPSLRLSAWRLYRQSDGRQLAGLRRRRNVPGREKEETNIPPLTQDLNDLREATSGMRAVIEIDGETADLPALHRYVAKLTLSPLFEDVAITRLESSGPEGKGHSTQFQVRIAVKPGPGQEAQNKEREPGMARRTTVTHTRS